MTDKATFKKIRKVLKFAWNNPYSSFYRDKYKKAGINLIKDVSSMEDFKKLPYLTREEITATSPYDRFFLPPSQIKSNRVTSGTSGLGKAIFFRADKYGNHKLSRKAVELGIKSCMMVHSPQGLIVASPYLMHKSIKRFYANIYDLPLTVELIVKLRADALSISMSTLSRLIPLLEPAYDLKNIKFINFIGEYCSFARLTYFKEKFPNSYFMLAYASSEAAGIADKCDFLRHTSSQIFHPLPHLYFEFGSTEEKDELILTHLNTPREFPIIRYKTGDMVKLIKEECPCGENTKIKLLGRLNSDAFKLKGIYIYPQIIDDVICNMRNYLDITSWKLHIFDGEKPKLKFVLIPQKNIQNNKKNIDLIKRKLTKNLYFDSRDNLESLIKKRLFAPIELEFTESIELTPPKTKNIIYHG